MISSSPWSNYWTVAGLKAGKSSRVWTAWIDAEVGGTSLSFGLRYLAERNIGKGSLREDQK